MPAACLMVAVLNYLRMLKRHQIARRWRKSTISNDVVVVRDIATVARARLRVPETPVQ